MSSTKITVSAEDEARFAAECAAADATEVKKRSGKPKTPCPHCGKEFQKLQEHVTKMHDAYHLKLITNSRGGVDSIHVFRNGTLVSKEGDWGTGSFGGSIFNTGCKFWIETDASDKVVVVYHASKTNPEKHGVKAFAKWTVE
jgi:uncharacterized C2H2 Zn-finger protein